MHSTIILCSVAVLMAASPLRAAAQVLRCEEVPATPPPAAPQPQVNAPSIFVAGSFTDLLDELVSGGFEELEASISADKDKAYVSWAPWIVSGGTAGETRFSLTQKDKQTFFGIGTKINPLSPGSSRGVRIWQEGDPQFTDRWNEIDNQRNLVEQRLFEIRRDACDNSDVKRHMQRQQQLEAQLLDLSGVGAEEEYQRVRGEWNKEADDLLLALSPYSHRIDELTRRRDELRTALTKLYGARLVGYAEELKKTSRPVVGLTTTVGLFSDFSGSAVDADDDDLVDNEHALARLSIASDATWWWGWTQLAVGAGIFQERASAEEGNELEDYWTIGATIGRGFILDRNYAETKAYKESLFVPLVTIGFSVTQVTCEGEERCKDLIERKVVYTPFVDFKIQKAIQFRLGLPFEERQLVVGPESSEVGMLAKVAFQLTF